MRNGQNNKRMRNRNNNNNNNKIITGAVKTR